MKIVVGQSEDLEVTNGTKTVGVLDLESSTVTTTYLSQNYVRKPDILYETDGTTGLLGVNNNELGENWQLENYDFTPYKYLKCYIKVADYKTSSNSLTPAMVIELPLDAASKAKADNSTIQGTPCDMYIAGGTAVSPSDQNQIFSALVAVDTTKTKFQVVCENRIYGTAQTNVNDNGRYCYKIEGCYDTLNTAVNSEFVETDPVFIASPAHGITLSDITNWNGKTSNVGTVTGVKMNSGSAVSPDSGGVVDLGTVVTSETSISKGTTSGSGNAVTDISVSGHQITLTKGSTFLTSHQDIKTINSTSLVGTGNIDIEGLPTVTSSDNGKVLMVVNGQ